MISTTLVGYISEEEYLVAELESLGVRYLSRQTAYWAEHVRPIDVLIAGLVCQPAARVRNAVIALLLAHPEYAGWVPGALARLQPGEQTRLRILYTAAVVLQEEHTKVLQAFLGATWHRLPDLFAQELGVSAKESPGERLKRLEIIQQQETGAVVNWCGTYEDVVQRLLHQWELELRWNQ